MCVHTGFLVLKFATLSTFSFFELNRVKNRRVLRVTLRLLTASRVDNVSIRRLSTLHNSYRFREVCCKLMQCRQRAIPGNYLHGQAFTWHKDNLNVAEYNYNLGIHSNSIYNAKIWVYYMSSDRLLWNLLQLKVRKVVDAKEICQNEALAFRLLNWFLLYFSKLSYRTK
jgi:hypothetical protein